MFERRSGTRGKAGICGGQAADFVAAFNHGLHNQQLVHVHGDRINARFYNCCLSSVFQPVVHAAGNRPVGHQGLLRAAGSDGVSLSPWGVFSFAVADQELVELDRLCRTLHVLNYYCTAPDRNMLYLNVQLRLLQAVGRDFGRAFEHRLERLGLGPGQVAIVLPPDVVDYPDLFAAALHDYQSLGYRVVASYPIASGQWPDTGRVRPDVIRIDGRDLGNASLAGAVMQAIHAVGALGLAARLESVAQVEQARSAGFELLQGHAIAVPATEPIVATPVSDGLLLASMLW